MINTNIWYTHRISNPKMIHINIKNGKPATPTDQMLLELAREKYGKIRLYYNGPRYYRRTQSHRFRGYHGFAHMWNPGKQIPTKCLKKDAWGATIYPR